MTPGWWHGVGRVITRRGLIWATTFAAVVCAGCGGAARQAGTTTPVTVPAYGVAPATTVSAPAEGSGDSRACRAVASSFAHDAAALVAHFGPRAAYPADLNYVIIRGEFADFRARRCPPRLLGGALARRLTAKQRAELVADLPRTMAAAVREALARAGSS
jgi:hypothetical protein